MVGDGGRGVRGGDKGAEVTKGLNVSKRATGVEAGGLPVSDRGPRTYRGDMCFPAGRQAGTSITARACQPRLQPLELAVDQRALRMRLTAGPGPLNLLTQADGPGLKKVRLRDA